MTAEAVCVAPPGLAPLVRLVPSGSRHRLTICRPSGPEIRQVRSDAKAVLKSALKGAALTRAVLLTLKYIARDELAVRLSDILRLFGNLIRQPDGLACLVTLLTDVSVATDRVDEEQLTNAVRENLGRAGEELMPTIAQKWRAEALEEGLRAGIRTVLELRFSRSGQAVAERLPSVHSVDLLTESLERSKSAATPAELLDFLDRTSPDE